MPTSFQNLIARLFWPRIKDGLFFHIHSQDVIPIDRPGYVQVNIMAEMVGQIPGDQSAWLVEALWSTADGWTSYHPKRPLFFAFEWQRFTSASYLSSGNPEIRRSPAVILVPKAQEPELWARLQEGRNKEIYCPIYAGRNEFETIGTSYQTS